MIIPKERKMLDTLHYAKMLMGRFYNTYKK